MSDETFFEETEESNRLKKEYLKMQEREKEYEEHLQNCSYVFRNITKKQASREEDDFRNLTSDIEEDLKKIREFKD